jgi:hypothetical protein
LGGLARAVHAFEGDEDPVFHDRSSTAAMLEGTDGADSDRKAIPG